MPISTSLLVVVVRSTDFGESQPVSIAMVDSKVTVREVGALSPESA